MEPSKVIRNVLKQRGILVSQLALDLGLSRQTTSNIANGWIVPRPEVRRAIARRLKTSEASLWPNLQRPTYLKAPAKHRTTATTRPRKAA